MIIYYEPAFAGLLCSLFGACRQKMFPEQLIPIGEIVPLFADVCYTVHTQPAKVERVWKVLKQKLSKTML